MNTDVKSIATLQQQPPTQSDRPSAHDLLIEVIQERKKLGLERYNSLLQSYNGRDQMVDLLQELVDGSAYLINAIQERDDLLRKVEKLEAIAGLAKQLMEGATPVAKFGVEVGNHEVDSEVLGDLEEAISQLEGK